MTMNSEINKQVRDLTLSDPDLTLEASMPMPNGTAEKDERMTNEFSSQKKPYRFVPLVMDGRTHIASSGSRSVLSEVSLAQLTGMTERFYEKAFQDTTLDKFIRSHDDPHGSRFAKWIHQKLGGSKKWDADRRERSHEPVQLAGGHRHVVHDRSSAHVAAWYSAKRPKNEVGRHFKLDECRVWMRLHFWSMREAGLVDISPSFADYYVRYIAHFVRVYESTAPHFARDSFRWSANPANIEKYIKNGRKMKDILGLSTGKQMNQIPVEETEDFDWPYEASEDDAIIQ